MSEERRTAQIPHWFPRVVAIVAGVFFVGLGLWGMADPKGFFDGVATFEPYNQHFIQDIGAFQIGLGAVLLLAALLSRAADTLTLALVGVGVGAAAHTLSHIIGVDLGGTPGTDIPLFVILTLLLLGAGWMRWRTTPDRDA